MNIGSLKHKITIQKDMSEPDSDGYTQHDWQDYYLCWAAANGLSNRDFFTAMSEHVENTVVFTVRYNKKVNEVEPKKYRIIFRNKIYDILGTDNYQFANDAVKIRAIEGMNNG